MKFKTDENLPLEVTNMIKRLGHDCLSVRDQNLGGCSDVELIEICTSENRILVTLDLDFSDIRRYSPNNYAGIIVIRDAIQTIPRLIELTSHAMPRPQGHGTTAKNRWSYLPVPKYPSGVDVPPLPLTSSKATPYGDRPGREYVKCPSPGDRRP